MELGIGKQKQRQQGVDGSASSSGSSRAGVSNDNVSEDKFRRRSKKGTIVSEKSTGRKAPEQTRSEETEKKRNRSADGTNQNNQRKRFTSTADQQPRQQKRTRKFKSTAETVFQTTGAILKSTVDSTLQRAPKTISKNVNAAQAGYRRAERALNSDELDNLQKMELVVGEVSQTVTEGVVHTVRDVTEALDDIAQELQDMERERPPRERRDRNVNVNAPTNDAERRSRNERNRSTNDAIQRRPKRRQRFEAPDQKYYPTTETATVSQQRAPRQRQRTPPTPVENSNTRTASRPTTNIPRASSSRRQPQPSTGSVNPPTNPPAKRRTRDWKDVVEAKLDRVFGLNVNNGNRKIEEYTRHADGRRQRAIEGSSGDLYRDILDGKSDLYQNVSQSPPTVPTQSQSQSQSQSQLPQSQPPRKNQATPTQSSARTYPESMQTTKMDDTDNSNDQPPPPKQSRTRRRKQPGTSTSIPQSHSRERRIQDLQQQRAQYGKPIWEQEGSLLSVLFGDTNDATSDNGSGGSGTFLNQVEQILQGGFDTNNPNTKKIGNSNSILVSTLQTAFRTGLVLTSRVFKWASVRGALPQPIVAFVTVAAVICSPPRRRLQMVGLTVLLLRIAGEILHGNFVGLDDSDHSNREQVRRRSNTMQRDPLGSEGGR